MADISTQSITIDAPPASVVDVICDFTRYPEWVSSVKSAEVVEEYEDGYASAVRFVLDAGVLADEYTLRYGYAEDLSRIEWHLAAPSRMQKAQEGAYEVVAVAGGGSRVTYTLSVELAIGVLGMIKRKAEKVIMDAALKDLKRRVETLAAR